MKVITRSWYYNDCSRQIERFDVALNTIPQLAVKRGGAQPSDMQWYGDDLCSIVFYIVF